MVRGVETMGRTSRRRERGGGVRRRRLSVSRTSKKRPHGERTRRRRRRRRGSSFLVCRTSGHERGIVGNQVPGVERRERRRRGVALGGVRQRREGKQGNREKRTRRIHGDYRRRRGRGIRGAVVRREVSERRERYLGRERRALSTYVRVGYRRGSAYATEAGRKYFRVGARGSTRRVLGRVRVYGETGRRKIVELLQRVGWMSRGGEDLGQGGSSRRRGRGRRVWVRRFKRGSRPVHRWVADVYEGAPTRAGRYRRIVPKRSRRVLLVRRSGLVERAGSGGWARREVRRVVSGRGTVIVGGRGRRVQRRWKRYLAYSGRGNVGQIRRGGRRRTAEGVKGMRRTFVVYMLLVRRLWGGRRRRTVEKREYGMDRVEVGSKKGVGVTTTSKRRRERKYRTERRGRGKESARRTTTRRRGRISRVGRPPRVGFGAKRSVYGARVSKGLETGVGRYVGRAGRGLRIARVGGYGYLRMGKRIRMEVGERSSQVARSRYPTGGSVKRTRRKLVRKKEGARRMGVRTLVRVLGWVNGEGRERRRDGRVRERREMRTRKV